MARQRNLHIVITSVILMTASVSSSQVVIDRQVIGSSGGSFDIGNSIVIEQTIGEAVIETVSDNTVTLTQGFHQPLTEGLLQFDVSTLAASCPTSSDGGAFITEITGCIPPYSIEWSNGVTEIDSLDRLLPGLYSVTVSSGFCQETVEFEVVSAPEADCVLRIFNAFTPDGDGKSDTWIIENIDRPEYRENRVEIFNRWGQNVFSASGYDNREKVWKGEDGSGNELLSGTYFYVLEADGVTYKGYIELIR